MRRGGAGLLPFLLAMTAIAAALGGATILAVALTATARARAADPCAGASGEVDAASYDRLAEHARLGPAQARQVEAVLADGRATWCEVVTFDPETDPTRREIAKANARRAAEATLAGAGRRKPITNTTHDDRGRP